MERRAVAGSAPQAPYSPGIVADGKLVFVAGQGPYRDGVVQPGTIEEQTRLVLENLVSVLREAGTGPENVVRCGVFLTDLANFQAMNGVYAEFFPDPKPARTTVQAGLIGEMLVEIDCVALVP
jgi:2-iminobutanoate/2-iminopropanoate deaminase